MRPRKILIMGLPGSGKTTLATALNQRILGSVVFDGDTIRMLTQNVDFTEAGRELQAMHIGKMCDSVLREGLTPIASFVCPTPGTRVLFWGDTDPEDRFYVFMDRIAASA